MTNQSALPEGTFVKWLVHHCEKIQEEAKEFSEDFGFILRNEAGMWDIVVPGNPDPLLTGLIFCPFCGVKLP